MLRSEDPSHTYFKCISLSLCYLLVRVVNQIRTYYYYYYYIYLYDYYSYSYLLPVVIYWFSPILQSLPIVN